MRICVKLFAAAKQLAGADEVALDLADDAVVADLRAALIERIPQLAPMAATLLFAIDAEYAGDSATLPKQAEVACIPPVSGG